MGKKKAKKKPSKPSVHSASWGPFADKIEAIGKKFSKHVADTHEQKREEFEVPFANPMTSVGDIVVSDHLGASEMFVVGNDVAKLVLPDGIPVVPGGDGVPSRQSLIKSGVHLGTESIGTDAWQVYRLADGTMYRVVDYPKENPSLGLVFRYDQMPPLYHRPDLTRSVTKAEKQQFTDTAATDARVAARVEVSLMRQQIRESERLDANRRVRHILEQTLAPWQVETLHRFGYFDIVTIHSHRYRIVPGDPLVFYLLSPQDEAMVGYRFKNEDALPDAVMALILTLRTNEDGVIEQCFEDYRPAATWRKLAITEFGPALARVSALEFVS